MAQDGRICIGKHVALIPGEAGTQLKPNSNAVAPAANILPT